MLNFWLAKQRGIPNGQKIPAAESVDGNKHPGGMEAGAFLGRFSPQKTATCPSGRI